MTVKIKTSIAASLIAAASLSYLKAAPDSDLQKLQGLIESNRQQTVQSLVLFKKAGKELIRPYQEDLKKRGEGKSMPQDRKEIRILFVMSGVDYVTGKDGKRHKTGYWAEEVTAPYREFKNAGLTIVVATPGGVAPTPDALSFDEKMWPSKRDMEEAKKLIETAPELKDIKKIESLTEKELEGYAAVFYPGGHVPMEDLAKDPDSGRILNHFHAKNKPTALVCHGPVALMAAKEKDKEWPYKGYKLTVFSNREESFSHLAKVLTYSVEDELTKLGGIYKGGNDWEPKVVEDRELMTGKNPASALPLAQSLVRRLKK